MRFFSKSARVARCKRYFAMGKRGAEARFRGLSEARGKPLRRPGLGRPLYTIRIENHITGSSQEIRIMQGERVNNYLVSCFGRAASRCLGMDKILAELRKRLVVRWISAY